MCAKIETVRMNSELGRRYPDRWGRSVAPRKRRMQPYYTGQPERKSGPIKPLGRQKKSQNYSGQQRKRERAPAEEQKKRRTSERGMTGGLSFNILRKKIHFD